MDCVLLDGNSKGEQDHFYELPQAIVKRWLRDGRYGRLGTIGDGSCFFHCICYASNVKGYRDLPYAERRTIAHKLREGLSERFTEEAYTNILEAMNSKKIPKSYKAMKQMMGESKTWAEEVMIRWTSIQLGLNVVFLNVGNNANQMYCGVHHAEATRDFKDCKSAWPMVVVVWADHSHFELLCRLDAVGAEEVTIRPYFDPSDTDDQTTIQNLLAAYVETCGV